MPIWAMFILTGVVTFSSCLLFDMIRRGVFYPLRPVIRASYNKLDKAYERLEREFERMF